MYTDKLGSIPDISYDPLNLLRVILGLRFINKPWASSGVTPKQNTNKLARKCWYSHCKGHLWVIKKNRAIFCV